MKLQKLGVTPRRSKSPRSLGSLDRPRSPPRSLNNNNNNTTNNNGKKRFSWKRTRSSAKKSPATTIIDYGGNYDDNGLSGTDYHRTPVVAFAEGTALASDAGDDEKEEVSNNARTTTTTTSSTSTPKDDSTDDDDDDANKTAMAAVVLPQGDYYEKNATTDGGAKNAEVKLGAGLKFVASIGTAKKNNEVEDGSSMEASGYMGRMQTNNNNDDDNDDDDDYDDIVDHAGNRSKQTYKSLSQRLKERGIEISPPSGNHNNNANNNANNKPNNKISQPLEFNCSSNNMKNVQGIVKSVVGGLFPKLERELGCTPRDLAGDIVADDRDDLVVNDDGNIVLLADNDDRYVDDDDISLGKTTIATVQTRETSHTMGIDDLVLCNHNNNNRGRSSIVASTCAPVSAATATCAAIMPSPAGAIRAMDCVSDVALSPTRRSSSHSDVDGEESWMTFFRCWASSKRGDEDEECTLHSDPMHDRRSIYSPTSTKNALFQTKLFHRDEEGGKDADQHPGSPKTTSSFPPSRDETRRFHSRQIEELERELRRARVAEARLRSVELAKEEARAVVVEEAQRARKKAEMLANAKVEEMKWLESNLKKETNQNEALNDLLDRVKCDILTAKKQQAIHKAKVCAAEEAQRDKEKLIQSLEDELETKNLLVLTTTKVIEETRANLGNVRLQYDEETGTVQALQDELDAMKVRLSEAVDESEREALSQTQAEREAAKERMRNLESEANRLADQLEEANEAAGESERRLAVLERSAADAEERGRELSALKEEFEVRSEELTALRDKFRSESDRNGVLEDRIRELNARIFSARSGREKESEKARLDREQAEAKIKAQAEVMKKLEAGLRAEAQHKSALVAQIAALKKRGAMKETIENARSQTSTPSGQRALRKEVDQLSQKFLIAQETYSKNLTDQVSIVPSVSLDGDVVDVELELGEGGLAGTREKGSAKEMITGSEEGRGAKSLVESPGSARRKGGRRKNSKWFRTKMSGDSESLDTFEESIALSEMTGDSGAKRPGGRPPRSSQKSPARFSKRWSTESDGRSSRSSMRRASLNDDTFETEDSATLSNSRSLSNYGSKGDATFETEETATLSKSGSDAMKKTISTGSETEYSDSSSEHEHGTFEESTLGTLESHTLDSANGDCHSTCNAKVEDVGLMSGVMNWFGGGAAKKTVESGNIGTESHTLLVS